MAIADLISLTVTYGYLTTGYQFWTISGIIEVLRSILSVQDVFDLLKTKDVAAIEFSCRPGRSIVGAISRTVCAKSTDNSRSSESVSRVVPAPLNFP
jgi:hypothetical protein